MNGIGIFLDRDGTINREVDFLRSPADLELIPRSADAIRELNACGWKVFVVTNHSGNARGILSEDTLGGIHRLLLDELRKHGASVDGIYYCPHHPDIGEPPYRKECDCRKPKTGMLVQAAREFDLDLTRSFVIGDRMIDAWTANNCGATAILVRTGYGNEELRLCRTNNVRVDYIADDLYAAVRFVRQAVRLEEAGAC